MTEKQGAFWNNWKNTAIPASGSTVSNPNASGAYSGFKGGQQTSVAVDPFVSDLLNLSSTELLDVSSLLKAAGYLKTTTSKYNKALGDAYSRANMDLSTEAARSGRPNMTLREFLAENAGMGGGAGKELTATATISKSTPESAAAKITEVFQRELKRQPTAEEITFYTDKLMKEEGKKSSMSKAVPKRVGGVVVTEYTPGLDKDQFLSGLVKKLPEFKQRLAAAETAKVAARTLTLQDLARTAMANGLDINKNFNPSTVNSWVNRIEAGEDPDVFKNLIRQTASVGLPDSVAKLVQSGVDLETVYAPYKRTMAAVLELPENAITLSDPTLRRAIGPDKPTNLYDFEKSLKKDPRWQYTSNAREEISNIALSVLRDFGFQG